MKRFALLLFSLALVTGLFAQDPFLFPVGTIVGADSTYFKIPFRGTSNTQVSFDFTGFSTDQVIIENVYYVFEGKVNGTTVKRLVPIEGNTFPVTLVKADHAVVANGVTSNMISFKLVNGWSADYLAFKVTKNDAASSDVLKMWVRK
jgi:hypothetical protein